MPSTLSRDSRLPAANEPAIEGGVVPTPRKVLLQLDPAGHASAFDSLVAIDSGIDFLLPFSNVVPDDVPGLVHGAMFTRSPRKLQRSAIFIGGDSVERADRLLEKVTGTFFGPFSVSVMIDASGANTTAAAAVALIQQRVALRVKRIAVFGATGAVGSRVCRLLGRSGCHVIVVSRQLDRAARVCDSLQPLFADAHFSPAASGSDQQVAAILEQAEGVMATGAAGKQLISLDQLKQAGRLTFAADLNAVPPVGIEGIDVNAHGDKNAEGVSTFGAIGIGGFKMELHRRCIEQLFEANDQVLDCDQIYDLAQTMG